MRNRFQKNRNGSYIWLFLICLSTSSLSQASWNEDIVEKEDNRNPLGCYDTGYRFDLKTLYLFPGKIDDKQSMYFLFNVLNQKLILYQMRDEESSRSVYLNHAINSHQWAVLSTTEKKVKFLCAIEEGKKRLSIKVIDCANSLRVCEYTNVRYGLNNRGNYWIVGSNSRNGALRDVVHYGIIPAP